MRNRRGIRTAVVGCGYWGKNLVRVAAQLSDLRLCVDTSSEVRTRIGGQFPSVAMNADFDSALDDREVDAIFLATPATLHATMAIRALGAGKHVFVEKPLALSSADAERMVEAAERAGRILMVGHLLEYHPAVDLLKRLIDEGALGDVYYVYSQRVNLGKVRSDENALWSLAPHDISVMLYLLGEEPESVEARGQSFLQPDIEDVAFVTLRFPSGRVGHIHVSWLDPHKERRLTLVGSKKMAVFDDVEPLEKIRIYDKGVDRAGEAPPYESYGESLHLRSGEILVPRLDMQEPLGLECMEFLDAVLTGAPPRSDGADGLAVVRVLEAAQATLDANRVAFVRRGP